MSEITAEMHLSRKKDDNVWAYGFVTVDLLKFPVQVRKISHKDGTEESFISYPRRKTHDSWENVVTADKELEEKIRVTVLEEIRNALIRDLHIPSIEVQRIILINRKLSEKICLKAIATVRINGLTIKGITVRRSKTGLFCNMPQHYVVAEKKYKDTVYGTSKAIQDAIYEAVLDAYYEKINVEVNGYGNIY